MAFFLVNRRIKEGEREYFPGEVVEFDPRDRPTQTLLSRGLILPVPADFAGASSPATPAESAPSPTGEDAEVTLADLMELTRSSLNEQAATLGIEGAEEMANKGEVAAAILAKVAEE
jgi:hypothetical protein